MHSAQNSAQDSINLFLYGENVIVAMVTIDGGKQTFQRDTVWGGRPQKMVTTDGLQKGLKTVLEEGGVNVKKMHKDDMIKTLSEMRDFKFQKSKVEAVNLKRGHRVMFILKFHCEINPIEHVWCHAKQYTRAHCDYSFQGLEQITALHSVDVEMIREFFRKVREYHRAYREGIHIAKEIKKTLKVYKSHRWVSESEREQKNA